MPGKIASLLVLVTFGFIFACSGKKSPVTSKSSPGADAEKQSGAKYTDIYDTVWYSQEYYQPDSIYDILVHYKSNTSESRSAYEQMALSPQGKCFINKMRQMKLLAKYRVIYHLPSKARVVEMQPIEPALRSDRALLLWMIDPHVSISLDDMYTCPEYTQGKTYFLGQSFVSLLDTKDNKVINTIEINSEDSFYSNVDTVGTQILHHSNFSSILPVSALKRQQNGHAMSGKYFTTGSTDSTDGLVQLLYLEDFNGDGKALEFAMFENFACASTASTLYGYSTGQDHVIQYPVNYTLYSQVYDTEGNATAKDTMWHEKGYWVTSLFAMKPKGFPRSYEIDFRGRGGSYNRYSVEYNTVKEAFDIIDDARIKPGDNETESSWVPQASE